MFCSDVFFDGSEFRTASGDTASIVSTDFMKFKILKNFQKSQKKILTDHLVDNIDYETM